MQQDRPFYPEELYKQYMTTAAVPVLSTDEQAWLAQHGTIRIGFVKGERGFFSYEEEGASNGVIADYIRYAESCFEKQRLDFSVQGFATQEAVMQALRDGKIDMIFHFYNNPYFAEEHGFMLSNKVMSISMPIITSRKNFNEANANVVAMCRDNTFAKAYISYHYPHWKLSLIHISEPTRPY